METGTQHTAPPSLHPPQSTGASAHSTDSSSSHLGANLAALAEVDPPLAERLGRLSLEDCLEPVVGRDGSRTFRRRNPDGSLTWFGRTSMPTVSGPALLENFSHLGGNLALHGIGQGLVLTLLAQRMEPHQTLFVLEPDPVAVSGVLGLYDLAAGIRSRQIVLVAGEDGFERLVGFLMENPGFDPPERFLQWPWQPRVEIQRFKSGLEDVHRVMAQRREPKVAELAARLRTYGATPRSTESPRCLLISRRHDGTTHAVVESIVAAAPNPDTTDEAAGWSVSQVDWHRPGRTTPLALLGEMDRLRPHFALVLNEVREQLGGIIPAGLRVVSWFLEPRHAAGVGSSRPAPGDRILAESPTTARRLIDSGIEPRQVRVLPPGASFTGPTGQAEPPPDPGEREWDVAVFADAVDLSARARGIELGSLAAIWDGMIERLRDRPEQATAENLSGTLEHIIQRARIRVTDPRVRADLLGKLEFDAADTILTLHYVLAMAEAGIRVRVWGRGWDAEEAISEVWAGPLPTAQDRRAVLARSPLVLDCCVRERLSAGTLDAALAGAVPLVRGRFAPGRVAGKSGVSWPDAYSSQSIGMPTYLRANRLVKLVRDLLAEPGTRAELAASLRAKVAGAHTTPHRLRTLWREAGEPSTGPAR